MNSMNYEVIIVDDDEVCLLLHSAFIRLTHFHNAPRTYHSAQDALDFFATVQDHLSPMLVLLDINMPGMNGWDFLDRIHCDEFDKPIYVVVVSSSVDKQDKIKAFAYAKVIDFIEKPLQKAALQKLKIALPWLDNGDCTIVNHAEH